MVIDHVEREVEVLHRLCERLPQGLQFLFASLRALSLLVGYGHGHFFGAVGGGSSVATLGADVLQHRILGAFPRVGPCAVFVLKHIAVHHPWFGGFAVVAFLFVASHGEIIGFSRSHCSIIFEFGFYIHIEVVVARVCA